MLDRRSVIFSKYQLSALRKGMAGFYFVLLALLVINFFASSQGSFSGGTVILLFVLGLNCFKSSFLFAQANNVSRHSFFFGTLLALVALAACATMLDFVLSFLLANRVEYGMIYTFLYPQSHLAKILWQFTLLTLAASGGWLITMVYYRSNTVLKYLVSLSPLALLWLGSLLERSTNGRFWVGLGQLFVWSLGLSGEVANPYQAVGTFLILSVAIWLANSLLMYKMPIKAM